MGTTVMGIDLTRPSFVNVLQIAIVLTAALVSFCNQGLCQTALAPTGSPGAAEYVRALNLFDYVDTEQGTGLDAFKKQVRVAAERGSREAQALIGVIDSAANGADLIVKLRPLADAGNVVAETFVGSSYRNGSDVSYPLAHQFLLSAANRPLGNANAQFELGLMYLNGQGVPANELVGTRWIRKSAANGSPAGRRAMATLAKQTIKQDIQKAACEQKVHDDCDRMADSAQPVCQLAARHRLGC